MQLMPTMLFHDVEKFRYWQRQLEQPENHGIMPKVSNIPNKKGILP